MWACAVPIAANARGQNNGGSSLLAWSKPKAWSHLIESFELPWSDWSLAACKNCGGVERCQARTINPARVKSLQPVWFFNPTRVKTQQKVNLLNNATKWLITRFITQCRFTRISHWFIRVFQKPGFLLIRRSLVRAQVEEPRTPLKTTT